MTDEPLSIAQVVEIATGLLESHRLTARQYDCFIAARVNGLSFRDAAIYLRDEYRYDISYWTVMMDSRYAHEIVLQACEEHTEGRVRLGHTLQAGSQAWFSPDTTLQAVARRTRVILRNKPSVR